MPVEWKRTTVGEFCTYYKGGTPFEKLEYSPAGIPVLAKGDIKPFGRLVHSGTRFVSPELVQERQFYLTEPGDFLMTTRDLTQLGDVLGLMARVPDDQRCLVNQGVNIVRLNSNIDWRFVVYWANGPVYRAHMKARAVGSTQIHIRKEAFIEAPIWVPPQWEQEAIVDILSGLDRKIDLNRQLCATSESITRALFKSWFVDFDPVAAKQRGQAPVGLDPTNAGLIPSSFQETSIGPIPSGWAVTTVEPHATLHRGTTYESRLLGLPGPVLLGLGTINPGGGFRNEKLKTYGGESPAKLLLYPYEVYVALKGATKDGSMVGSVARVPPSVPCGRLTQDTVKLAFTNSSLSRYFYWALQTPTYRDYCAQRATGSAQVGLSRTDFLSYPVVLPPARLLDAFAEVEGALAARAYSAEAETAALTALRDQLVPRLLCGELRVRDAERIVEAVA